MDVRLAHDALVSVVPFPRRRLLGENMGLIGFLVDRLLLGRDFEPLLGSLVGF